MSSSPTALLSPIKGGLDASLKSPLPSPGFLEKDPLLLTKSRKPVSRVWKVLGRLLGGMTLVTLILVFWGGFWILFTGKSTYGRSAASSSNALKTTTDAASGMAVGGSGAPSSGGLPDTPSPVLVTDVEGKTRWTQAVPSTASFPLAPKQYADMCSLASKMTDYFHAQGGYYPSGSDLQSMDPNYMDVKEARTQGLLPNTTADGTLIDANPITVVGGNNDLNYMPQCNRSMTFVMETTDAGFGSTLMNMWTAYGLAEREGRAFFIDDTRWPYGSYSSFFQPPPLPSCAPPPPSHIVPCPRQAQHVVVSAATLPWTFGPGFSKEHISSTSSKPTISPMKTMFTLARAGYEHLFSLMSEDAAWALPRADEIHAAGNSTNSISIGVQVRRGDRHPAEKQYSRDYLPLERYSDAIETVLSDYLTQFGTVEPSSEEEKQTTEQPHASGAIFLASDDPDVFTAAELSTAQRAQDRIVLASASALSDPHAATAPPSPSVFHKYVPENSGWEGGFFAPLFWSLGRSGSGSGSSSARPTSVPTATAIAEEASSTALRMRELIGRAYLLDLDLISQADTVVCGANAMGCRLLAVMMGWESAIEGGKWVNIDHGVKEWRGVSAVLA